MQEVAATRYVETGSWQGTSNVTMGTESHLTDVTTIVNLNADGLSLAMTPVRFVEMDCVGARKNAMTAMLFREMDAAQHAA